MQVVNFFSSSGKKWMAVVHAQRQSSPRNTNSSPSAQPRKPIFLLVVFIYGADIILS